MAVTRRRSERIEANQKKAETAEDTQTTTEVVLLKDQAENVKWKKWRTRVTLTFAMIFGFLGLVSLGHIPISFFILTIQFAAFNELISISYQMSYEKELPYHRTLNWYFVCVTQYYLYFEMVFRHERFGSAMHPIFDFRRTYHSFLSYSAYMVGILCFILTLKKGLYKYQFKQFAWTHLAIVVIIFQSSLFMDNLMQGIYWVIFPASLVVGNDCAAYMCGFFYGATPLIKLSPKKTWEGFIGGAIFTLFLGVSLSWVYAQSMYMICPKRDIVLFQLPTYETFFSLPTCDIPVPFVTHNYSVPASLTSLSSMVPSTVPLMPVQVHGLVFAFFASIVAPFGGFFASGFKRAYNIKDFGNVIPGHGGILDRFDCHLIMGVFTYIYLYSVLKVYAMDSSDVLQHIADLSDEDKRIVLDGLQRMLA